MIALLAGFALAEPLQLATVLQSLEERLPTLLAAEATVEGARASVLARRGAFDPVLTGKAAVGGGKYVRDHLAVGVEAPTVYGPSVAVGYERGTGDIPDYIGDQVTVDAGELQLRLDVPLLKGMGFGKERAELEKALVKWQMSEEKLADTVRKIRWKAGKAYWSWVAAGMDLQVVEEQLRLAERRAAALERQVEEGSRAALDRLDNQRVLEERRAKHALALQKLEVKAIELSLFFRDEAGEPIVVAQDRLPSIWPEPEPLPSSELLEAAWEQRPDLRVAGRQVELASVQRQAASNALLPKLNAYGKVAQPLEPEQKNERVAGLALEMPLAFRRGVGERREADASLRASRELYRYAGDRIRAEIRAALVVRRRAEERARAARLAAERAREVLELERRRYELGGSDLFKVLQREDALAKARSQAVEAERALRMADVQLHAVMNRWAL